MPATNSLVATLLAMTGQRNIITIPRAFVGFTGTLESAMLLNQLLYWMPRSHLDDNSIYKTDADWKEELCLTRYAVRQARDRLTSMGFLTTSVHHKQGTPAVHYHIDYELLIEKWEAWLRDNDVKSENELYPPPSKVRKRTLLTESSSNPNNAKFESEQTMNHRVPTKNLVGVGGDGRTLAFLIDHAVSAAKEFAHLPYESTCADYEARRAEGQSNGNIVRAWRRNPPTKDYHYGQQRSPEPRLPDPGRNGTGSPHGRTDRASNARPRPGDPAYYRQRAQASTDGPADTE